MDLLFLREREGKYCSSICSVLLASVRVGFLQMVRQYAFQSRMLVPFFGLFVLVFLGLLLLFLML